MKINPINIFVPKYRKDEIITEISECLDKGWTGLGFKTVEFEREWNCYTGLSNSVFLSSNTAGLQLSLRVFGIVDKWEKDAEIITTPLTFVSTNHVILHENLKPIFCDVDEYLCIDPVCLKNLITPKTKAVMFVGIGGNPGKLDEVKKICKERNLRLILDGAHMAGTYIRNDKKDTCDHVGQEADASVFSFQAVKNLPTADSGIISFRDVECYNIAKKLSWLGIDKDTYSRTNNKGKYLWKYDVPYTGFKFNGNSIMASIGLVQLKYLDEDNDYRNTICNKYFNLLSNIKNISFVENSDYCYKSSKHLFQILIKDSKSATEKSISRDEMIEKFYDNNVFPGVHYIDNTEYPMYNYAKNTCPRAHKSSNQLISLPLHLGINDEHVAKISNILREALGEK